MPEAPDRPRRALDDAWTRCLRRCARRATASPRSRARGARGAVRSRRPGVGRVHRRWAWRRAAGARADFGLSQPRAPRRPWGGHAPARWPRAGALRAGPAPTTSTWSASAATASPPSPGVAARPDPRPAARRLRLQRAFQPFPDPRGARAARRRDGGLAVGDPAVVRRQPLRDQHAQPRASSARARPRAAAGSGTRRRTAPRSPLRAPPRSPDTRRRPPPRARCGSARRPRRRPTPLGDIARRRRGSGGGRRASARRRSGEVVRVVVARIARRLELDRGLALVGHLGANAAQRRHGVEQPAHARRRRGRRRRCRTSSATVRHARGRRGRRRRGSGAGPRRPPRRSHAHAIRHGSRIAAVAARQPHRPAGDPARSKPAQVADEQLAAPDRAVGARSPVPSKIAPTAGPVSPCSARHAARCAWWCWTPTSRTPSRSSAYCVER